MRAASFACLVTCLLAAPSFAQAPVWTPADSLPKGEDWILISSGEWLRGEIEWMRDGDLQIDSKELDVQVFSWSDIAGIRSGRQLTYVFPDRVVATGPAALVDRTLTVGTGANARQFRRSRLLSIIPGSARERDYWSVNAGLGWVGRAGNTEQTDVNAYIGIKRAAPLTRTKLDYNGNLGTFSGEETINNHRGVVRIDAYVARAFYVTLASIDILTDKFQNIDLRVTPGAAFGWRAVRSKGVELDVEIGGGYQYTTYGSVEEGADESLSAGTIVPALKLELDPTSTLEFDFNTSAQIGVPDAKESFYHAFAVLSFDLTKAWEFDVSAGWDHVQTPKPDSNGNVPRRDDIRTTFGISVEY